MPNLAGVLKEEIRRLARKEARAELAATKKASAQYRKDIASLKRQLHDQVKQIRALARTSRQTRASRTEESAEVARFSPKWLQAHRDRLGLSASDYAALIGVSAQTVYNWERGRTRPAPEQLEAWGSIRRLGKREAWARLEELG